MATMALSEFQLTDTSSNEGEEKIGVTGDLGRDLELCNPLAVK